MSHGVFARNFERTLELLATRGHHVHVALDQMHKPGVQGINELLERLADEHEGITYGPAPPRRFEDFATIGRVFRLVLDVVRYQDPAYAPATKPRARMESRLPRPLRAMIEPIIRHPSGRRLVRRLVAFVETGVPTREVVRDFIERHAPDAIVVTPLVDPGSPQTEYVKCARELGVPSLLALHSWDNLTVKGGIHAVPDLVAVWNDAQRRESRELHGVPSDRIVMTGAVAYDWLFDRVPSSERDEFCRRAGLDPSRPYTLYLGSSRFIAPNEGDFVREWATALQANLPNVQVLIRPHPLNSLECAALPPGFVVRPSQRSQGDRYELDDYFDSIFHSKAVVGVLTSAMIEAAIVGRPVHSLTTPHFMDTRSGTLHFRYLLPENGGMLRLADSHTEHAAQLAEAIAGNASPEQNERFVVRFVRPFGIDQPAASRLVAAIERVSARETSESRRTTLRMAARLLAGLAWLCLLGLRRISRRVARPSRISASRAPAHGAVQSRTGCRLIDISRPSMRQLLHSRRAVRGSGRNCRDDSR